MTRLQIIVVSLWAFLTVLLYFGFDTRSFEQKEAIEGRALEGTGVEVGPIVNSAKESLADADLRSIQLLEGGVESSEGEAQIDYLKQLSGKWYRLDRFLIAGHYAERVAEADPSGTSWGIAGTTYMAGINHADPLISSGCFNGAIRALENAISLDPDTVSHRVNLALAYTEKPPQENPMKGIQMLLNLNEKFPQNVVVLTTLARLAINTGQFDRAEERLQQALGVQKDYQPAVCLLANLYQQIEDVRAPELMEQCELLTK